MLAMPIDNDEEIEAELMPKAEPPATMSTKRGACSLDDAYIFNFTNDPKGGKTQALREAGFDGEYISQEAHRMHNRLRPKINAVLKELTQDIGNLARQQLDSILNADAREVGFSNMLGAIKLGFDYSGNKPQETSNQEAPRPALSEVQRRIEKLQGQINEVKGIPAPE